MRATGAIAVIVFAFTIFVPAARGEAPPPGVSNDWLSAIQADIEASEYHVAWSGTTGLADLPDAWQAPNRAHGFRTYFTETWIRVIPRAEAEPSWEWGLALRGYGRGGTTSPVSEPRVSPSGNRVDYARGSVGEWYVNDSRGLEQGFTLFDPPEVGAKPNSKDPIHLDLELTGTLDPVFSVDAQAIDFRTGSGANVIHFAQLVVTDARGHELPAWMEGFAMAPGRGIRIVIDAREAVYPITVDPLVTSPSWTAESNQTNSYFGYSVATAGDVNGDGYSDVIVGCYYYSNGETNEGRAFVYHGSASGLSSTPAWTAESNQASAYFGRSVGTAGDVNGDGYSDVIVGADYYDNGETTEGRAYVFHGSASGLSSTPAWTAEGNQASVYFGVSVGTAGDVNGDGYSDVIVGAYFFDNGETDEGRAFVYHGSASGLSATPAWTGESDQASSYFGRSVGTAGDVNGDGYADVIVGAYFFDNGETDEGRAFVYHGSASGLSAAPAWTAEGNQDSAGYGGFGRSVGAAGDVNGDGYADVIVGADYFDNGETSEGRAFVYHGSASGLSATPAWTGESNQASSYFGRSVGTAGDVNGDGYADVIVGTPGYNNGQAGEGRAFVYLGSASGLGASPTWTAESDQSSSDFGWSVATAGDVNGDGYSDVVVGARMFDNGETNEGRAFVYHGSAGGLAAGAGWTALSDQAGASLGYSVGTAGDVNGDGYGDVIVGAFSLDNGQLNEGRAFVYLGSAAGLAASPAWTAESDQDYANFGYSVAPAGDVNGDGYADVIVGARNHSNGQDGEGRAFVYLGSAAGLAASPAWTAESDQDYANFGYSVATAGDVNGDGYADVIVGARRYYDSQTNEGRAYVYLGSAAGLAPTAAWTAKSDQPNAYFGTSVATAGDVNGDGYADVIVGADSYDNDQTDEGRAYVYLGSPAGLAATAAWTAESDQAGAHFGVSVATAGDVNGDGYADVIVGAEQYTAGQTYEGRAHVYLGAAAGLAATPSWTAESDQVDANFGYSVATAGDVNGDGYADVIVGARYYDNGQMDEGRAYVYLGSPAGLAATATWTAESNQAGAHFGVSVATAGDVNGDGYADAIVGANDYDYSQIDEGRAYVYSGNGGGAAVKPQQRRADDSAPVGDLGWSDGRTSFRLAALGRTPFGRGRVRLESEVEPFGTPFDGAGTVLNPAWLDTGTSGVSLNDLMSGLSPATLYHWRVRLRHDPSRVPFQQSGRWFTVPRGGWQEADLRTGAAADLSVHQTDAADPIVVGDDLTWNISVANAGPETASVMLRDTLPSSAVFESATPSQGSCSHMSGIVTCNLGSLSSDGNATVTVVAKAPASGTLVNSVAVEPASSRDPNPSDNSSTEETTVLSPRIGDFVWEDRDGDGVQDGGEPGMVSALVYLFSSNGTMLNVTFTDANGRYQFDTTLGASYFVRFIPPAGYVIAPRDQGADDLKDSDADPATGDSPVFSPIGTPDTRRWDAGMVPPNQCYPPDEPIYIYAVRVDGEGNPILDFQDPNQPRQVTGYNVYRSSNPALPPGDWPLVGSDVIDMDEATPNKQWVDQSGDPPPGGIWYYDVAAFNHNCPAEGPR